MPKGGTFFSRNGENMSLSEAGLKVERIVTLSFEGTKEENCGSRVSNCIPSPCVSLSSSSEESICALNSEEVSQREV
jgi:hypothetical protein